MASWSTPPKGLAGEWIGYRQVGRGYPPLFYGFPGEPPSQPSARWNVHGASYAQYLALSPEGAWAEHVRAQHLRTERELGEQRRRLWQVRAICRKVADLATFDRYVAAGLDPQIAIDDDHRPAMALAEELVAAGYDGVLSPSAAVNVEPEVNLTLFGARMEIPTRDPAPCHNPDTTRFCQVTLLADEAQPPLSLVTRTRYQGLPHVSYEAWAAMRRGPR